MYFPPTTKLSLQGDFSKMHIENSSEEKLQYLSFDLIAPLLARKKIMASLGKVRLTSEWSKCYVPEYNKQKQENARPNISRFGINKSRYSNIMQYQNRNDDCSKIMTQSVGKKPVPLLQNIYLYSQIYFRNSYYFNSLYLFLKLIYIHISIARHMSYMSSKNLVGPL